MDYKAHGLAGKSANNAFNLTETEFLIKFTMRKLHGILLPGCVPGYKRSDIQILQYNKTSCLETLQSCYRPNATTQSSSLLHILQNVEGLSGKPMTDLCAQCHKIVLLIKKAVNMPEDLKTQVCYE